MKDLLLMSDKRINKTKQRWRNPIGVYDLCILKRIVQQKILNVISVVRLGHWQRACRNKEISEVAGKIFPNDFFLGEITVESIESESWEANLEVNYCKFQFKLNSGADVTVVLKTVYDKVSNKQSFKLQPADKI